MGRFILVNGSAIYDADVYSLTNLNGLNLPVVSGKGDMIIFGESQGGKPGKIEVLSQSEIKNKLYGGLGANLVNLAFRKGADPIKVPGAANKVIFFNAAQNTQGTGALSSINLKTTQYGLPASYVSVECLADTDDLTGYARFINAYYNDGTNLIEVKSTSLGNLRPLNLEYTGSETTATVAVTATKLTIIIGASTYDFLFATYDTMAKLVTAINATITADLTVTTPNPNGSLNPATILDIFSAQNIKTTGGYGLKMGCYECLQWLNNESVYVADCTRKASPDGDTIPAAKAKFVLTGAVNGVSINSNWQDNFNASLNIKAFNAAIGVSSDTTGGATFASILAMFKIWLNTKNSFTGKKEIFGFMGGAGNFAAHKAYAASLNNINCTYVMQGIDDIDLDGNIVEYPACGKAVVMAQSQIGAPLCENLTKTEMPYSDIIDPTDFDSSSSGYRAEASKAGILIAYKDDNGIIYTNVALTSKVDSGNNAEIKIETRESLLNFAYNLRENIKYFVGSTRRAPNYTGGGKVITPAKVIDQIDAYCIASMGQGEILDYLKESIEVTISGNYLLPKVKVQPIEGIDFIIVNIEAIRIS